MRRILPALIVLASCGGARTQVVPTAPEEEPQEERPAPAAEREAPWAAPRLARDDIPSVYFTEWRRAANRDRCPLFALTEHGSGVGANPRRIDFGIGWGVAYDKAGLPGTTPQGSHCADCGRSAFGVAGTAASRGSRPTREKSLVFSDGSTVFHGPAGPSGRIAYLEVAGVECVYHIWSALGEEHLEVLLRGLRRVDGP